MEALMRALFPGESEMAHRMRWLDWAATALGPPDQWAEPLKHSVKLCLTSRFPIVIYWGPERTMLYNDPYIPFLGETKHPSYLGRAGREVWSDIWDTIDPMFESVMCTGEATWSKDFLFFFARNLPREEVYVTFTIGPILFESGAVGGFFCPCTEVTEKVVGARRLETLRKLGVQALETHTIDAACEEAAKVLAENPYDIPFAALYLVNDEGTQVILKSLAGFSQDVQPFPASVSLSDSDLSPWPLASVLQARRAAETSDLIGAGMQLPGGPWPEPASKAIVLPIFAATHESLCGLAVLGLNPRRVLDDAYRTFFELIAGHIGTAISNAKAYEAERERAEALAELDRTKTAFFSNISHEFRTPLTLMLSPIEDMLARANGSLTVSREELDLIHRNSIRLLKLVNTLLDFSRIEAGRMQASYEPTDLAAFTAELASVFRAAIESADLRLVLNCPPLPEPVYVDPGMWEKIVLNLMSNAFKFTFEGEIALSLRQVAQCAELSVCDTGTGIPEHELPHLFDRFHRVEGAQGRTYEGSGIGLALVQELVRLHGGSVRVESIYGRGSRFTVSIPLGCAHLPAEHIGGRPKHAAVTAGAMAYVEEALGWLPDVSSATGGTESVSPISEINVASNAYPVRPSARILLADDNADMRHYVQRLLTGRYEVHAVGDGEAALAVARENPPDLVLADIMMPRLDGFGLLQALRADPRTRSIPVILLSARAGEESRVEGLEARANDYLIKPFSARELLARVSAQLEIARLGREALEREHTLRLAAEAAEAEVARQNEELQRARDALQKELATQNADLSQLTQQLVSSRHTLLALKDELAAELTVVIGLHEFSTRLVATTELQPLLEKVLQATIALQNADFGNVQLYNPQTQALEIVAQRGFQQEFLDYFSSVHEGTAACGAALQCGERVIVEDVQTDPVFAPHRHIAASAGYRAVQSTPLFSHSGEPLGMISTHFRQPHRPSERELRLTDLYARQAAEMIERKQAEEELRKVNERVEMILGSITDNFFGFSKDWRFTYLNKHAAEQMKVLGKDPARLIGKVLWEEFPDVPNEAAVRRVMSERVVITDELYYPPLGEWVENHMYPSPDGGLVTFQKYITERKRAEEQLHKSEERWRAVFENSAVGIAMINLDGRFLAANAAYQDMLGYSEAELRALSWMDVTREDDRAANWGLVTELLEKQRQSFVLVKRNRRKDGHVIWVNVHASLVPGTESIPRFIMAVVEDITERKRAEEALHRSQQQRRRQYAQLETIYRTAPVGLCVIGAGLRFIKVNKLLADMNGLSPQAHIGRTLREVMPGLADTLEPICRQVMQTGAYIFDLEIHGTSQAYPGEERIWRTSYYPVKGGGRKVLSVNVVVYDITERKRAEQTLARSAVQLSGLAEVALAVNAATSLGEILTIVTDKARDIIGAHMSATWTTVDNNWAQVVQAMSFSDKYAAYRNFDEKPDGSSIYALVCELNRPMRLTQTDIEAHPAWRGCSTYAEQHPPLRGWLAVPLVGSDGQNIGLLQISDKYDGEFTAEDEAITVQLAQMASVAIEKASLHESLVTSEAHFRDSERRLRLLAESIPQHVWGYLPDLTLNYCNQRWMDYFALTLPDAQREGWAKRLHPDDVEPALQAWREAALQHKPYEREVRLRRFDGRYRRFLSCGVPLYDERGQLVQWFGTNTDIEELKQAEGALYKAQEELTHVTRATTMGELAGSLAHELNQPLAAIVTNGSACLRWLGRGQPNLDEAMQAVQRIIRDATRAGDVIVHTRALLKKSGGEKTLLDVTAMIREVLVLVHQEVRQHGIVIHASLVEDLPPVLGARVELQQVVLNLIVNGIEAMTEVSDRRRELVISSQRLELDDGPGVLVAVQDTGIGVAEENLGRLFDAFFTTKPQGLGMGLSVSRSIIEAHGGRLWASPKAGPGATFQFILPTGGERVS